MPDTEEKMNVLRKDGSEENSTQEQGQQQNKSGNGDNKESEEKQNDNKASTGKSSGKGASIMVNVGKNYDNFNTNLADIEETVNYPQRGQEMFLMSKKTHSSIMVRPNGQINLSSSLYSQYKLSPSGKILEQSLESNAITNRRKVNADDIVINDHKFNPFLYELTDMKALETAYNDDMVVGNFCIYGSVLVKAWEVNLHRYVLLRRPARIPMFSPVVNVPEINPGIHVTDPLKIDEKILAKSKKGYQVNKVVSDSASLIGKDGVDRPGINRNPHLTVGGSGGNNGGSGGNNGGSASGSSGGTKDYKFSNVGSSNGRCKGGSGGGMGSNIIGNDGPLHNMSSAEIEALRRISMGLGVPMDWIYCQCAEESGLDSYNGVSEAARDYNNYSGIMNPGGESAGLKRYSSINEWADDYIENIMGLYYAPDCTQAKTAQDYYHCLQHQEHKEENYNFSYCANPAGDAYVSKIMSIANDRLEGKLTVLR